MAQDLFEFWAKCPDDARVHPDDQPVFDRAFVGHMGFDLRCLPAGYAGRLRTAPVVLLYLSPGWAQADVDEADTPSAQIRYADRRKGNRPLDGENEHPGHFKWWSSRTKVYGSSAIVRDQIAILNLAAYHSKNFRAHHGLAALPSCRAALDWAHTSLFPEALAGRKVVVCMRAAENWGLTPGKRYDGYLFAPPTVRGGYMRKNMAQDSLYRQDVIDAVNHALTVGQTAASSVTTKASI